MRIAVNTRLLLPNKLDGIGWFTYHTLKHMVAHHPQDEFVFIFDRPYSKEFVFGSNVTPVVLSPPSRHPVLWYIWFHLRLPVLLKKVKADVFLSPDGYLPLKTSVKTLAVIHDINFEHFPKQLPWFTRWYYRRYFPKYARISSRLATVSAFSKQDICKTYDISPEKIDVVYNGVDEGYKPVAEDVRVEMRQKYTGGKPFLIFIGSIHQRKNIIHMLLAFDHYKSSHQRDVQFVIAGSKLWWTAEMERTVQQLKHKSEVHFTGRIDPASELQQLTASAEALLYVPFFEGFGLPVVEAQRCGVVVITSDTSCLPEVAGEGALYCDPNSIEEIANAIQKVLENQDIQEDLRIKGLKNSQRFSWEETEVKLWECLKKTVNE